MPIAALAAPTVTVIVIIVVPRLPETNRYTSGTSRYSTSCLQSVRLRIGLAEKHADTSVAAPYASSGQKKAGTSTRSRREITSASQQRIATANKDCAMAIENCSAAATPNTASSPNCSSQSVASVAGGADVSACALVVELTALLVYRRSASMRSAASITCAGVI